MQLPGVNDVEQAKRVIKTTAQLALKLVEDSARDAARRCSQSTGGKVPDNMEVVSGPGRRRRASPSSTWCARRRSSPAATSRTRASASTENNEPDVQFTLNPQGADKFKRETGRNVGRRLAIILDGTRRLRARHPGADRRARARSRGRFTAQEADELAKVLRAGALPATLRYLQELTVGASLGRDSIRSGRDGLRRRRWPSSPSSCSSTTGSPA